MDKTLLAELADRFLSGTATEQEKALLHEWFDSADKEDIELVFVPEGETEDAVGQRMLGGLQAVIDLEPVEQGAGGEEPVEKRRRIGRYVRWAAAAAVLIVFSVSGILYWKARKSHNGVQAIAREVPKTDLLPGSNKATLTLGDGSMVNLGAAQNGLIKQVAGTRIDKRDSQLIYAANTADPASEMNTIQTPRGGQYQVVLPDGTRVWLDAASSLTYPTAFTGKDRSVRLKGEAYFEVAENKDKPFMVTVEKMEVHVLGTHFNIMAYDDEDAIKTTLLEGAVKVKAGEASHLLASGQQASLDRASGVMKILQVDVAETVAWKNGEFELGGGMIGSVMRQMSRWYDVDVEYQGTTDQHFRGSIPRSANASEVFKMLELTGAVHFSIEGKKIIVRP